MQFKVIDSDSSSITQQKAIEDLKLLKRLTNINDNSDIDIYTE